MILKLLTKICGYDKAIKAFVRSFIVGRPYHCVFVSGELGSDANDGLTPQTAKKTFDDALGVPGVTEVRFRMGEVYRWSPQPTAPVVIGAYGKNGYRVVNTTMMGDIDPPAFWYSGEGADGQDTSRFTQTACQRRSRNM